MLKRYVQYSTLAETISQGRYDCLTATTYYALLLRGLGYEASIVETDFHIFLVVQGSNGKYIFESTNPIDGFMPSTSWDTWISQYNIVNAEVSPRELLGLHYLNLGVRQFNSGNLEAGLRTLEKASIYYPSERVESMTIVMQMTLDDRLDNLIAMDSPDNFRP